MPLTLNLPPEQEKQFHEWAAQQGEKILGDAQAVYNSRLDAFALSTLFLKALALTQPLLDKPFQRDMGGGQYLLLLIQTMTALYHANAGRPYTPEELSRRTLLEEAMALYDLQVVSLEIGAKIAGVSQQEFLDALGKAGIPALQYTLEEAIAEADAA